MMAHDVLVQKLAAFGVSVDVLDVTLSGTAIFEHVDDDKDVQLLYANPALMSQVFGMESLPSLYCAESEELKEALSPVITAFSSSRRPESFKWTGKLSEINLNYQLFDLVIKARSFNDKTTSRVILFVSIELANSPAFSLNSPHSNILESWERAMDFFEDGVYLLDTKRRLLWGNKAFYEMIHKSPEQAIHHHIVELIHPNGELSPCRVCQAQENLEDAQIIMEAGDVDNPVSFPIEINCRITRYPNNEASGILMSIKDLSKIRQFENQLAEDNQALREAQQIAHMGNWVLDLVDGKLHWSDEIYRIFGLIPQQIEPSYEGFLQYVHPDDRESVMEAVDQALYQMQEYNIEHRIRLHDGSVRYVKEMAQVNYNDKGEPIKMLGTVLDITQRVLSESALRKSEQRFKSIFNQAAIGIALLDNAGKWLHVNSAIMKILDFPKSELIFMSYLEMTYKDDAIKERALFDALAYGESTSYSLEKRFIRPDGNCIWASVTLSRAASSQVILILEDIDDKKYAEQALRTTLKEKDLMLQELHHRVKNNMQVISSMLSLQARYVNDSNIDNAFINSRERVRSLAVIHDRIYGSHDLNHIDLKKYLHYLSHRLAHVYANRSQFGSEVNINLYGGDVTLNVGQAIPCALITYELLSNALLYASTNQGIDVSVCEDDKHWVNLIVRDYGAGVDPEILSLESPKSLGLIIIKALSRQIGGKVTFQNMHSGTFDLSKRTLRQRKLRRL